MNRRQLKILACSSMLADHICRAFFRCTLAGSILRITIGRLAFPLFAYMLVQGFYYTRDRKRYALQLLITALVSEPLFDLAFHRTVFYRTDQNTIFTLLLSLILFMIIDRLKGRLFLQLLIAAVFACAAQFARLDYGAAGIAVCLIFYFTTSYAPYISCLFACIPLIIIYGTVGALLTVPVLYFYKNERMALGKAEKIGFYLFYPVHLLLLALPYLYSTFFR